MKLDALLEKFPWDETLYALCREPPPRDELPLRHARRLIEQQRDSQLAVLSRMMHSPILEGDYEDALVENDGPQATPLRLRSTRQASHLFLAVAAQAGKALLPFGVEHLGALASDDAALGHLLLALSAAQSSPNDPEVRTLEFSEIAMRGMATENPLPFGQVLTPMVVNAEPEARYAGHGSDTDFAWGLTAQLSKTTDSSHLPDWTRRLVDEGATHLRTLTDGQTTQMAESSSDPAQELVVEFLDAEPDGLSDLAESNPDDVTLIQSKGFGAFDYRAQALILLQPWIVGEVGRIVKAHTDAGRDVRFTVEGTEIGGADPDKTIDLLRRLANASEGE